MTENRPIVVFDRVGVVEGLRRGMRKLHCMMEMFIILTVVMAPYERINVLKFTELYFFKHVAFIVYELFSYKGFKKVSLL